MFNGLRTRWKHARAIAKTWSFVVPGIWGIFWAADAAIEKWDFGVKLWWDKYTTQLPSRWEVWMLGLLVLVIFGLIDGSYRIHTAATTKHENETLSLQSQLSELKESLKGPIIDGNIEFAQIFMASYRENGKEQLRPNDSVVEIKVRLTCQTDHQATVRGFSLTLIRDEQKYTGVRRDMRHNLISLSPYDPDKPWLGVCQEAVKDIQNEVTVAAPLRRGVGTSGWLSFYFEGLSARCNKGDSENATMTLIVKDEFNRQHPINASVKLSYC
jgi:hypothetical protein